MADPLTARRLIEGFAALAAFAASIPLANWMIGHVGTACVPGGPCLVPVAPGLSKSLKLFLTSFRNHGAFHEDCTVGIGKRLVSCLVPRWLRLGGYWYPRGGVPIDVFWRTTAPPDGLRVPDMGVAPYRGRG